MSQESVRSADIEVPVLIAGAGPAGLTLSLALTRYGVPHMAITRYPWTAHSPRAHITNQRTIEIFRDLGVEDRILAAATPDAMMANCVWATSLAGEELGRLGAWGNHPERREEYRRSSPSPMANIPQHVMEPILAQAILSSGGGLGFHQELIDFEEDATGVTSRIRDVRTGREYSVRSRYLVGADGGRSMVAEKTGIEMLGAMGLGAAVNIWLKADLGKFCAHRPGTLYWIMQPGSDYWVGNGTFICVKPWDEWVLLFMYDPAQGEPDLDAESLRRRVLQVVGEDVPVEILAASKWTINRMVASRYATRRVFLAGDAAHRHPPANGLGTNTSMQDAYNLAWKLKLVIDGQAPEALLETYSEERQPVGAHVVDRAMRSVEDMLPIAHALDFCPGQPAEEGWRRVADLAGDGPDAQAARQRLADAIALQNNQFNGHGVEMGQRYRTGAVAPDPLPEPAYDRDPELYYHPTTWTGARLPHVWLEKDRKPVSTHDIVGKGHFTLLTGHGGDAWRAAAALVSEELGVPIDVRSIGFRLDYLDPTGEWARVREIADDGAILVRPDAHVGWRSIAAAPDAAAALMEGMSAILRLAPGVAARAAARAAALEAAV